MHNIKIYKTRKVKTPIVSTVGSAGIDFFIINDFPTTIIKPHSDLNIESGIKCIIPNGWCLLAVNKSGIALNYKLQVGACLIDSDYTGELHLHVYNYSNSDIQITGGMKLVQFIVLKSEDIIITELDDWNVLETKRSSGG